VTALTVLFDVKNPQSYLAFEPTLELIEGTGVAADWQPFPGPVVKTPVPPGDAADRGTLHRWHRARYQQHDLCRYAAARGLAARHFGTDALYRPAEGLVAALGFNWVARTDVAAALDYLQAAYVGFWDADLDVDAVEQVERLVAAHGDADGFTAWCEEKGPGELAALRTRLVEEGAFAAPACLVDGEAFVGRQHLAYLASRLATA
jgi:2-hydroxychromene-2-carboxylate isomerase